MSSIVVVTVTKIQSSGATVIPTTTAHSTSSQPTSSQSASSHPGLSSATIAGIVIGILVGGFLLIVLVFYLLKRYSRRKPIRAPNSAYDRDPTAENSDHPYLELPSTRSSRFDQARLSLQPSFSSEPLLFAKPFPHSSLPPTPQAPSPSTPYSISFDARHPPLNSRGVGEIPYSIHSDSVSHLEGIALSNAPPVRSKEQTLKPQRAMFIHRMLQSRARASEGFPLEHRLSVSSRSTTLNSSTGQPDEERLLADAECAALQDADAEMKMREGVYEEPADDSVSLYSQLSADPDHATYFSERQNGSTTPRRISSRKRPRTPAAAELPPVPEVPDIPSAPVGQSVSRAASSSSLRGHMSHGRASPPVTLAPEPLHLLTSVSFGNGSTASGTPPGSMSSNTGSGLNSSGKASRYPSLAASSIGNSSRPGPRPDDGTTDWRHPPTGLAGLKTLQIGPMHNPHSPVDEHPEVPLAPNAPAPVKRAHLREGTTSSAPEVEWRDVTQGGIASIEVAL